MHSIILQATSMDLQVLTGHNLYVFENGPPFPEDDARKIPSPVRQLQA